MSRTGVPIYSPRQVCKCFVTIERENCEPGLKLWRGSSKKAIQIAARKFYGPEAQLQFGNQFWVTL